MFGRTVEKPCPALKKGKGKSRQNDKITDVAEYAEEVKRGDFSVIVFLTTICGKLVALQLQRMHVYLVRSFRGRRDF